MTRPHRLFISCAWRIGRCVYLLIWARDGERHSRRKAVAARHGFFAGVLLPAMVTQTITALVYQQNRRERVDVFLDGTRAFSLAAILAASLAVGQNLTDEAIVELQMADGREQALTRAVHFLSFRPRSEAEVRRYLVDRGVTEGDVEAVVARLLQVGYLDDQAFAQAWVTSRSRLHPRGTPALRYELQQKGISPDIIRTVLAELVPDELAYAAARQQAARWRHLDTVSFRQKMSAYLGRRGFTYDVIRTTVDRLLREAAADTDESP